MKKISLLTTLLVLVYGFSVKAQMHPDFTVIKSVKTTPVKNQQKSGTCWAFATVSFLETEALRMGKPAFDLSEMFIVRHAYSSKAKKYVRYHGMTNFSQGGQAHDVLNVIKKHGIVPENLYTGLQPDNLVHDHKEMAHVLKGVLNGMLSTEKASPSPTWLNGFNSLADNYLGKTPSELKHDRKNISAQQYASDVVGIKVEDYVELTSYQDYPFYQLVDLEVPDNWSHDLYYNVPFSDLMKIVDNALSNGFSVCWDGDVSEEDFNHEAGTAVLSLKESDGIIMNGIDKMRQISFDNYTTTDDHLMHITGLAKDKNNAGFYLVKNSWGTDRNKFGGYLYMSKWYLQLKTVAIMVHKNAIPKDILKKLGLK